MAVEILIGDALETLQALPDKSVHMVMTSPPYLGLRDYECDGQIGLEGSVGEFIARLVPVFREVRRVLRDDGTLWLNIGDSYRSAHGAPSKRGIENDGYERRNRMARRRHGTNKNHTAADLDTRPFDASIRRKNMMGIPWRLAFALQDDGWELRQDIIWSKPNPMPESTNDRCTKSHEYLFLLSKKPRYYFNQEAILEPASPNTHPRVSQDVMAQKGSMPPAGKRAGAMKAVVRKSAEVVEIRAPKTKANATGSRNNESFNNAVSGEVLVNRNKRSVWTIATQPFKEGHFATYPPALVEPCVLAGCPVGGTVLDPFFGAGTTGLVTERLGRNCIGIEINPKFARMARDRIRRDLGTVVVALEEPTHDDLPLYSEDAINRAAGIF